MSTQHRSQQDSIRRPVGRATLAVAYVLSILVFSGAPRAAAAGSGNAPATRLEVAVDGFPGSAVETFEALSLEGGVFNTGSDGGGGGAGKAFFEDLVLTKPVDAASAKLLAAALTGRHLRSVVVRVFQRASNGSETLVLEVTATDVLVTRTHAVAPTDADAPRPGEAVTFEAAQVKFDYPAQGVSITYNVKTGICTGC